MGQSKGGVYPASVLTTEVLDVAGAAGLLTLVGPATLPPSGEAELAGDVEGAVVASTPEALEAGVGEAPVPATFVCPAGFGPPGKSAHDAALSSATKLPARRNLPRRTFGPGPLGCMVSSLSRRVRFGPARGFASGKGWRPRITRTLKYWVSAIWRSPVASAAGGKGYQSAQWPNRAVAPSLRPWVPSATFEFSHDAAMRKGAAEGCT